jgi:UDP-glucose 4-epimerase
MAVNLTSGQSESVREVIGMARPITGLRIDVCNAPGRPGDSPIPVADASRARTLFGWTTERLDLVAIMTDAWRWHAKRFAEQNQLL